MPIGATTAELTIEELPEDTWYVTVFLDLNLDADVRGYPQASGDTIALPDQVVDLDRDSRIRLESVNEF